VRTPSLEKAVRKGSLILRAALRKTLRLKILSTRSSDFQLQFGCFQQDSEKGAVHFPTLVGLNMKLGMNV
jgi:hypothetical protein